MTAEERFEKIERAQAILTDQMTVAARLGEESEKRFNRQSDDLWEFVGYVAGAQKHSTGSIEHLRESVQSLAESVEAIAETVQGIAETVQALADRQANTQAALDSLIAHIDRFVKGHGGNGQP